MTEIRDIAEIGGNVLREAVLSDGGVRLCLLNYGAITRDWRVPCGGGSVPVVLGYGEPRDYLGDGNYLGAIIGRVANRTAPARFDLDGASHHLCANEGPTHIHGGPRGLHTRFWSMEPDSTANALRFDLLSKAGDGGYPGDVAFALTVTLKGSVVTYDMEARTSARTPINMAQHNYYNLAGRGDIWEHRARISGDRYLPLTEALVPTGDIVAVSGSAYDFRRPRRFGEADLDRVGTDINLVFPAPRDHAVPVARFEAPSGLCMQVTSDQPGAQLYSGTHLAGEAQGHGGQTYGPFSGFCFEPQMFPNALNIDRFPSIVIDPDRPYRQKLTIDISENAP